VADDYQKNEFLYLPVGSDLMGEHGQIFLNQLVDRICQPKAENREVEVTFIVQDFNCAYGSHEWTNELAHELLADDLTKRIFEFRKLLRQIANGSQVFVYVTRGHCFGRHLELALSCQRFVCFNSQAQFGFPEIKAGGFPPGGFIENLDGRASRIKEKWKLSPIIDANGMELEDLLDFSADSDKDWKIHAQTWLSGLVDAGASTKLPRIKYQAEASPAGNITRQQFFADLDETWFYGKDIRERNSDSFWDSCWDVVKDRRSGDSLDQYDWMLSRLTAHFYLSEKFLKWAISESLGEVRPSYFYHESIPNTAYIDLTGMVPPSEALYRMLLAGIDVVYGSDDGRYLIESLERSYIRLDRFMTPGKAKESWDRQVSWFLGEFSLSHHCMVLQWGFDDFLKINFGGNTLRLLPLDGNRIDSRCGISEVDQEHYNAQSDPVISAMSSLLNNQLIFTNPISESKIPVSIWLRSLLIEEVINLSGMSGRELDTTLQVLAEQKWGFIARQEDWGRFLQTRYSSWASLDESDPLIQDFGPSRTSWNIGTWKVARLSVVKDKKEKTGSQWNVQRITQHLANYCALLVYLVRNKNLVANMSEADQLCIHSFGFPESYGLPSYYLEKVGLNRMASYAKSYWPNLWRNVESELKDPNHEIQ
jgi:hypothetical protein